MRNVLEKKYMKKERKSLYKLHNLQQNPKVKELTKKTEEGFTKMVEVTKKALQIDQNQNQVQQSSNMQYTTQSAQFYDSNQINQPLIENYQGYQPVNNSYQHPNETHQQQQQGNIEVNYPSLGSNSTNLNTNYPKHI